MPDDSEPPAGPNGMDPPEHWAYRAIIDRYVAPDRMASFEPVCRRLTRELIDTLPRNAPLEATRSGDREATARVAAEFDATIRAQLADRREAGDAAPDDATTRLLRERVRGRPLSDEERISIIRNWTAGELATIAASLGIMLGYLAFDPEANASSNLLYGAGIHACPGAPLARLELRVALEEAFTGTSFIEPVPGETLEPATFPTGGYARVPLRFSAAAP